MNFPWQWPIIHNNNNNNTDNNNTNNNNNNKNNSAIKEVGEFIVILHESTVGMLLNIIIITILITNSISFNEKF